MKKLLPIVAVFSIAFSSNAIAGDADLALAKKSGCFACHAIDKKIVGPSWVDIGARYKGDAGARDLLISKVKKGGKGAWTEVTKGVPMPPYSPRVKDDDIASLVDFILTL